MAIKFNPLTGNFDFTGSGGGGGGSSYIDGEVQNFSALPQTIGSPAVDSAYLVREAEGAWLLSRKPAGIYIRTDDTGVRADDWTYAGEFPDVFNDANLVVYANADSTKNVKFDVSAVTTGTTRTITVPDANVTLPNQGTSTGDSPTFAQVTINDTVNDVSTLTLANDTGANIIEFEAQELSLNHTGGNDTPYISVSDGVDEALLGLRQGDMFLQGSNAVVRIEKNGGALADIKVNKLILEDATTAGDFTATFDPDANLSANRTYDLPDASGTLALGTLATGSTDNAVLRADGTGGSTAQASNLIISDDIREFTFSGVGSTDVITATGHNFTTDQLVRVRGLSGSSGLFPQNNYYVRDLSGGTFKVSLTIGGSAVNINDCTGIIVAVHPSVGIVNASAGVNSSLLLTPKGDQGLILGPAPDTTTVGGDPRGTYSVDLQILRASAAQVASGSHSIVLAGQRNTASGNQDIAGGFASTASGGNCVALGSGNTASGPSSVALGDSSVSNRLGLLAHAAGLFSALGDAQRFRAVLRCKTTTNAAVEMALNGTTTYLTIPSGKVIFCNIKVVGVKSDGSEVATYERQYAAKNVAGTSSEVYAAVTIGVDEPALTSLEIATVDAGDYIRIRPTGIASETWRWVASVDAVEVAYGS
jgi:hypothetical protein